MAAESPAGVLLMAYGTPASLDDVEAYYTDIRRGRPPTPELLDELRGRYAAIGGVSPLLARTKAQVAGVAAALGDGFVCALGQKHAAPFVEDGIAQLAAAGAASVVGVVLAPHYSALSVGEYHARASAASAAPYAGVESWHLEPGLVSLLADRVKTALASFDDGQRVMTLVTAHSLPARVVDMGDPYPRQLEETAAAVMDQAGVAEGGWRVAWQSAGRTPEPWLGPDVLEVIAGLADDGFDGVAVCPAGFTSDHLEVLYDIDVQARAAAEARGLKLVRTESLNDDPALCSLLADVVRRAAGR